MDSITQNVLPSANPTILIHHFNSTKVTELSQKLLDARATVFGVSAKLSRTGDLEYIALAASDQVYLFKVDAKNAPKPAKLRSILNGFRFLLAGFDMAKLALLIHDGVGQRVRGVDLSTILSTSANKPSVPSKFIKERVSSTARRVDIDKLWRVDSAGYREVCLRAWLSASAAECCKSEADHALKVDTDNLGLEELKIFHKIALETMLLRNERPDEVKNEFSGIDEDAQGELVLQNSRYKTRARASNQTSIVLTNEQGEEFTGRARHGLGKSTTIILNNGKIISGAIESVRTIGQEELTPSERARDEFILLVLRGERNARDSPFCHYLWFSPPDMDPHSPGFYTLSPTPSIMHSLNDSQKSVMIAMLDHAVPLVIAHGPPGTGKTSTISAAVKTWDEFNVPVWVVAHSNVAVKNIAESLLKRQVDFKLLVSPEFYVEWHEHIYDQMQTHLLQTDELSEDSGAAERKIDGSTVLLCTLSMLSNPLLAERRVFQIVPMEVLVVDEASQIEIGEYMHLFHKFKSLRKTCFFGDPKQLPPYGKDTVKSLQSVFEIKHLKGRALLLNTQYRMPTPLGDFISEEMYNKKLHSSHKISTFDCVAFVDVTKGHEVKNGTSWTNPAEVQTIVHLVGNYYRKLDFCVITPYDAQRVAIENQLKAANLPWERVFNVDSFQGNEAEYVIISVVRSTGPGFLISQHRVNVMLTRCKAGMVIVTSKTFLRTTGAQYTMLGSLAQHWTDARGELRMWTDWKQIAEQTADMPGAPGPRRLSSNSVVATPVSTSRATPTAVTPASLNPIRPSNVITPAPQTPSPENFPALGRVNVRQKPTSTAWASTAALKAVKNAEVVRRPYTPLALPPAALSVAVRTAKDYPAPEQFPSLNGQGSGKQSKGQRKNGPVPAKPLW